MQSSLDLWGEAALQQPGGPSYAFFARLLPPLRYVDARFHDYPIALSAPGAAVKGRLVSNGSQINALANQPNWVNEAGIPIHIMVGREREPFGADLSRLDGPTYQQGYLPIVLLKDRHDGQVYQEEVFASSDPKLAAYGTIFARFTLLEGNAGKIAAQVEAGHQYFWSSADEDAKALAAVDVKEKGTLHGPMPAGTVPYGAAFDQAGSQAPTVMCFDEKWSWNKAHSTLSAHLDKGESAAIAVFTKPANGSPLGKPLDAATYFSQREQCAKTWNELLSHGMTVSVPEAVVNNAWRATVIGNYMLLDGDQMRYSAGNQYATVYIGEGGDATRAIALWGHPEDAERMMLPIFAHTRKGLEFHQAAFKLQMLANLYLLTRDRKWVTDHQPLWDKEINVILNGREKDTGLLPRERYCGDIATQVYSLNSNANCWRALRDMSVVLEDLGEHDRAKQLATTAAAYRKVLLEAIEKAKRRDVTPPFLPVALSGEEELHDPIFQTRMGGYWDLMINYILGSGVFPYNSRTADEVLKYLQTKGGLCMGMTRVTYGAGWWVGAPKINDLYGMRYALLLLERDEPDRALVCFYGKLAQGFTRDTFIDGEASSIGPLDPRGRQFYLPPNSAGNASFLEQLRYILVGDYDLNDDGKPDTLRLLFATPRSWLADGKTIEIKNAPTTFGNLSLAVKSELNRGEVTAQIDLPAGARDKTLLRLRLPDGYAVQSASAAGKELSVEHGENIDLTGLSGHVGLVAKVSH